MSHRATILVPTLANTALLEGLWAALEPELTDADQLILIDDSGEGVIAPWAETACPRAQVLTQPQSAGTAAALLAGALEASGKVLIVLQPDVRVEPGFIAPLVEVLQQDDVGVAAPRLTSPGEEGSVESSIAVHLDDGRLHVVQRDLGADPEAPRPVPYAPLAAFAVRREALLERGLDETFVPFGWADVDLGLWTWRAGGRVLEVPGSRASRVAGSALEEGVPEELVRASYEKNRLLTLWKYVDNKRDAHDHIASLWRDALDAAVAGRREELLWMVLALQELPRAAAARGALAPGKRVLEQVLRVSDPVG